MQVPQSPPVTGDDASSRFWQELEAKLAPLETSYLHWDELQQIAMPVQGINHKQWWQLLKAKRRARLQALPITLAGQQLHWVLDDRLLTLLTKVERLLTITLPQQFGSSWLPADQFMAEAIATEQLAGSSIGTEQARQLLCTGMPVETREQAGVLSAYHALHQPPTPPTLANISSWLKQWLPEVRLRDTVFSHQVEHEVVYTAPAPEAIPNALEDIMLFANCEPESLPGYMHPIIKAIISHYLMSALHPFEDGNGRIARAVFYRQMLRAGYSAMADVAISATLNKDEFYRAFLLTQSDGNDITYFIMQQLKNLLTAIEHTLVTVKQKQTDMQNLPVTLTWRQRWLLAEAQPQPSWQYRLACYQQRMQITYETSRTDLMKLAKHGLLKKRKISKAFVYSAL